MKVVGYQIDISTSFEGCHRWPSAFKAVEFLKFTHRHIFHVNLRLSVEHEDRAVEFIFLKNSLTECCNDLSKDMQFEKHCEYSCETIAKRLAHMLSVKHPDIFDGTRTMSIKVSEDNENGALVFFEEC